MMLSELNKQFKKEIDKEINRLNDYLSSGKAKDYSDYKRLCGEIAGLQKSVDVLKTAAKHFLEDEDDL